MLGKVGTWFRGMPLFRKILLPYLALVLVVAVAGAVIVAHDMSARAQASLDQRLSRAMIDARSSLHERELYLLESANFAANETGMATAARGEDDVAVQRLLRSVLALKHSLDLLAIIDPRGRSISEFDRTTGSAGNQFAVGSAWGDTALVRKALSGTNGDSIAGIVALGSRHFLAVAAPVCGARLHCAHAPIALAGLDAQTAAGEAVVGDDALTLFSASGSVVVSTAAAPPAPSQPVGGTDLLRVRAPVASVDTETLYGELALQGRPVATLAISEPVHAVFASVRKTAYRLAVLIALAMLGVIAIGALLSRAILTQLHSLVRTTAALGAGDLSARAAVHGDDEVGQLAGGVNEMADRLQAAVTTLESQAEQTAEEVKRLLGARTEFFAGLSHEFRTPLAIIRAQADLLLERPTRQDKATRETLQTVRLAAAQALELVNEILELSRTEAEKVDVDLQPVHLLDVVSELRPIFDGLAGAASVEASVDIPRDLPALLADPRRLRDVLLNLVDNAVKYTPAGGRVTTSAHAVAGGVEILVQDTGVGIPDEALDRLFEPFYRAPGVHTQRGQRSTGLGLALTRRLVDAMGGDIECRSTPGEGTSMRLWLPAWSESSTSPSPTADTVSAPSPVGVAG